MNSLCKKDIEAILTSVAREVNLSSNLLISTFERCKTEYFANLGVTVSSEISTELIGKQCEWDGCNKHVNKPKLIDGHVYCSVHIKQMIKDAKKCNGAKCQHVYTSQSKNLAGKLCLSSVISGTDYCSRHQKKKKQIKLKINTTLNSYVNSDTECSSVCSSQDDEISSLQSSTCTTPQSQSPRQITQQNQHLKQSVDDTVLLTQLLHF
jgi:hypothetical protein